MKYIPATGTGKMWNISTRRVVMLCSNRRIKGAQEGGAKPDNFLKTLKNPLMFVIKAINI